MIIDCLLYDKNHRLIHYVQICSLNIFRLFVQHFEYYDTTSQIEEKSNK